MLHEKKPQLICSFPTLDVTFSLELARTRPFSPFVKGPTERLLVITHLVGGHVKTFEFCGGLIFFFDLWLWFVTVALFPSDNSLDSEDPGQPAHFPQFSYSASIREWSHAHAHVHTHSHTDTDTLTHTHTMHVHLDHNPNTHNMARTLSFNELWSHRRLSWGPDSSLQTPFVHTTGNACAHWPYRLEFSTSHSHQHKSTTQSGLCSAFEWPRNYCCFFRLSTTDHFKTLFIWS